MADAILHSFERSSCTRRVRIALALKGIDFEFRDVDIFAGDNRTEAYLDKNPQGQVPVLEIDGAALSQSVAILEYLEETRPEPALLPGDPVERARCRQIVEAVNSGIQPLQNSAVLKHLAEVTGDDAAATAWGAFWIHRGLVAVESILTNTAGTYCMGDQITMADVVLAPQCFNAGLFNLPLTAYPAVARVHAECLALPAFAEVLA